MSRKRPVETSALRRATPRPPPSEKLSRVPPARWQTRPLPAERAEALRALAHAALDEQLDPQLSHLQATTHVTAEKLERLVQDCVRGVGRSVLGSLLESEAWVAETQDTARAACPTCGQMSPRARNAQDEPLFDEMSLETLLGPVPWRAPLFACSRCRRFFSPSPPDP
jgi:hypothetical protein